MKKVLSRVTRRRVAVLVVVAMLAIVGTGSAQQEPTPSERAREIANRLDALTLEADSLATDAHALADDLQAMEVAVSGDVSMTSLHVPEGETFDFDPAADTTLRITNGSALVEGTLEMKPASPDVEHKLVFENVDEEAFVGGGLGPVDANDPVLTTDPGLWCMRSCLLDIRGAAKTAWTYEPGTAEGWAANDEMLVAPTEQGDETFVPYTGQALGEVTTPWGRTWTPEVFNLTRNVSIEGTATGRAHVFIRSDGPQTLRYASLRHLGPRQASGWAFGKAVTGRWPLHFHHAADAVRGSLVEGVVVRDSGGHAFVAHGSHGVTFRNGIAYNVQNAPYWWDLPSAADPNPESNDILYDRNLAALVQRGDENLDGKPTAFFMVGGLGNEARGNVAAVVKEGAGNQGNGFRWDNVKNSTTWAFHDNLAHNVSIGVRMWSNHVNTGPLTGFQSYSTNGFGITHGAYTNDYEWTDAEIWGSPFFVLASSKPAGKFAGMIRGHIGGGTHGIEIGHHVPDGEIPGKFRQTHIWNVEHPVVIDEPAGGFGWYQFCEVVVHEGGTSRDLEPSDFEILQAQPESIFQVQRRDGTAYQIHPDGTSTNIPGFCP